MINPRWLEGAFIVINDAIDYEDDMEQATIATVSDTNIHLQRYREFVGKNPDGITYFQPILDRLDYAPSKLEFLDRTVLLEGKADFFAFYYFSKQHFGDKYKLNFVPSSGANNLGPIISLFLGWGLSFIILLDKDTAGENAGIKYQSEWFLADGVVNTLGDAFSKNFKKRKLENLISEEGKKLIAKETEVSKISKKNIARFFQEKVSMGTTFQFDKKLSTILIMY